MNINVMEKKMEECKITIATLSQLLNISESTFYRKKKRLGESFSIAEAQKIAEALKLSPTEASSIFFDN